MRPAALSILLAGCRPGPASEPTSHGDDASRSQPSDPAPRAEPWTIHADGVGEIRVGAPLPAGVPAPERYALRLYADAQPLEGFWFGEPAVFAALADGPFHRFIFESGEIDEPPAQRFAANAVADALAGAKVEMVYVESGGITTAEGVGVGTRFEDFVGVYADAQVAPLPPLFEEPTCIGQTSALPNVHFFFVHRCDGDRRPPPDAPVHRIAVRAATIDDE